jgi:hypothetical protein
MLQRIRFLLVLALPGLVWFETPLTAREQATSHVTVGANGFLRVNDRPFFPIGMYSASSYPEMSSAGFNATHSYAVVSGNPDLDINPTDARLKHLLDRSWTNGMRMMVELPRKAIEQAKWAQVRRRIETFRHHPGLLCWGSEERVARGRAPLTNLCALYQLVHELDPDHPLVLGDARDVIKHLQKDRRNFFPDGCMDIGIWWWYPIPLRHPDGNGLEGNEKFGDVLQPPSWLTTTLSKKPLWIAIQAYEKPRKGARFPTPAEYRCMAYLSIINGVKGLWFYTGSGQRDWQGKPAGLLNKRQESHWDYVQKLVRELHELSPVIMAKPAAGKITMTPSETPVEFASRELNGGVYLLAANKSGREQKVRFSAEAFAGKKVHVLYEEHAATMRGDTLEDQFEPYGVHVYRLE